MNDRIREPLPSLYVQEGYFSFSVMELWELLKDKLPAADLAEGLWAESGEVRERFRDLVLRNWDSFTDGERRSMLSALKAHVHNKALDDAVEKMARIEGAASDIAWRNRQYATFELYLRSLKKTLADIAPEALAEVERLHGASPFGNLPQHERDEHNNVVGPLWREARAHWRERAEAIFLKPEQDAPEPTTDEVLL